MNIKQKISVNLLIDIQHDYEDESAMLAELETQIYESFGQVLADTDAGQIFLDAYEITHCEVLKDEA